MSRTAPRPWHRLSLKWQLMIPFGFLALVWATSGTYLLTRTAMSDALNGEEWEGEVVFERVGTGDERYAHVVVRPVRDETGAVIASAATMHDLTELRRVQQEQEQFLSIVSHELRTPLTPLKALAQLLISRIKRSRERGQPLDLESFERNLSSIERQVDRMNGLVSDLLSVSRAGRGILEMDRRPFDLALSVRDKLLAAQGGKAK